MLMLQLNVVPSAAVVNVVLSDWLTRFFPGPSVSGPLLRTRVPCEPSVMVILTLTKIVTVLDPAGPLLIPNFHVCTPPVLESESLWVQLTWVRSGGAHPAHCDTCWTWKSAVVLWSASPGLLPVMTKW